MYERGITDHPAVGYPYFPGEIIDPNWAQDDPIPQTLFDQREAIEKQNQAQGQETWLIRFYDRLATYVWLPASKLDILGGDDGESSVLRSAFSCTDCIAVDAFYLAVSSVDLGIQG